MSTFNGLVAEFPDIRIDFFRNHASAPPPLACFLSHVHSDHLAGLESLRSPFVYCSAATREILLRLERYPCRINYALGILEARQQTYKHLSRVLKPLPLETPTVIELRPGYRIQATLFDANHCPGAVMFLIEGHGKAVLYTGDIRCEPWFVNALARNPILIEYTCGLKTLDKIYLDTSFVANVPFQSKSDGIAELLRKVSRYPNDTVFHIQAWTYGYEDVWVALSRALKSPIHVDDYKMQVYSSLRSGASGKQLTADHHLTVGAAALTGHMCGNTPHPGCLTAEQNVRLHSCEKGNMCATARNPAVIRIQPIVARLASGDELAEAGVGGGGDDLEREAELAFPPGQDTMAMLELISSSDSINEAERHQIRRMLRNASESGRSLSLNLGASAFRDGQSTDLQTVLHKLSHPSSGFPQRRVTPNNTTVDGLPRVIQFPYSRHSSYPELCQLVEIFKPRDVWPCTVDQGEWKTKGISIESLFGNFCSGQVFEHDLKMASFAPAAVPMTEPQVAGSQLTDSASRQEFSPAHDATLAGAEILSLGPQPHSNADTQRPTVNALPNAQVQREASVVDQSVEDPGYQQPPVASLEEGETEALGSNVLAGKRKHSELAGTGDGLEQVNVGDSQESEDSVTCELLGRHSLYRAEAYYCMLENATSDGWRPITLLSTDGSHSVEDREL